MHFCALHVLQGVNWEDVVNSAAFEILLESLEALLVLDIFIRFLGLRIYGTLYCISLLGLDDNLDSNTR